MLIVDFCENIMKVMEYQENNDNQLDKGSDAGSQTQENVSSSHSFS